MLMNPFKKFDLAQKRRESSVLKKTPNMDKEINKRIAIAFLVVIILFSTLLVRMMYLQLYAEDEYDNKLAAYTVETYTQSSPRGTIYDSDGNILVESVSSLTISYYPLDSTSEEDEWELAFKLVSELGLDNPTIYDRNVKEMYIQYLSEVENDDATFLLTEEEILAYEAGEYTTDEYLELKISKVDVSQFDDTTRMVYQVRMAMDALPTNSFKAVVEDVSEEQLAIVSENASEYPGFKCTFDWKRSYSEEGISMYNILGSVSSSTQGIPSEQQEYYTALGYDLNSRVGTSGLEYTYEQFLSGTDSEYTINFDENGDLYLTQTSAGKSGYDITLTIDSEYQSYMQEVLNQTLEDAQDNEYREYFDNVYLVALNPQNGEVYGMVGSAIYNDEIVENPTGTYLNSYLVGSCIKPAVVYMGLNEEVIYSGEKIYDTPITIKGSPTFSSYKDYGWIDEVEALRVSSNIYMAMIAIRLAGAEYVENEALDIDEGTFDLMRNYFNMFGLGVSTGIDLPNEQVGTIGYDVEYGKILYYAIGQYDTYTTMQLAQYVSTIANGGSRIQPHILDTVSEVNDIDTIIYSFTTNILGVLLGDTSYLENVEEGMLACVTSGNCGSLLMESNVGVQLAAKTGTSEAYYYDSENNETVEVTNSTLVAYQVGEDSEFAVACSAPNSNNGFGSDLQPNICMELVAEATKAYFDN